MDRSSQAIINLVFLHGFLGSPQDFDMLISALDKKYSFQLLDLTTFLSLSDTLPKLKVAIPEGSIGIGYSMGGRVLLLLAVTYPTLFKKIILLSASPGIETQELDKRKEWEESWIHLLESQGLDAFLEKWYDQPLFASLKKNTAFKHLSQRRKSLNPLVIKQMFKNFSITKHPSLWNSLKKLPISLLYLVGESDSKYLEIANRLSTLGKHIHVKVIPHAGHALHIENPLCCATEMMSFISNDQQKK